MALSIEQFQNHVVASGLLTLDEISTIVAAMPDDRRPKSGEELARELIRQKSLTKYQAEQLYAGKGKTLILGNYVVLDKLGQGGMGVVLKAEHRRLKRLVALKVMSANVVKTPDALKRFHREVEAAAKLRHPNVVATDDADEAKGTHFLVMEYVEGSDLSVLVKKQGPLFVDQAIQCILQAAKGLEFAHSQGVVHRDIKPANLLLDSKGTVKILDMGLARIEGDSGAQGELTSTGAVMGTVDYMAPEQALSTKHADARSDVYSLGISLWYLLTDRCVYDGDSMMAKLLAHRDAPIPSLSAMNSEVPAAVEAVFRKMVAKQPGDRYQTMTDVIRAIEGCQNGTSANLTMPAIQEDLNLQSFLSNLSGSPTSTATTRKIQTSVKNVVVNAAAEATILSGNMAVDTDPHQLTSLGSPRDLSRDRKRTQTTSKPASKHWSRNVRFLAGGGAAALLLLLMVFVFSGTPEGQIRVEISDPEVKLKVKGTDLTFGTADKAPVSLAAGDLRLVVTRGDLSFETKTLTINPDKESLVSVKVKDANLIVDHNGQIVGEKPLNPAGATMSQAQISPPLMTPINSLLPPEEPYPDSPEMRRTSEWVLKKQGVVTIRQRGVDTQISSLETLPAETFKLVGINLAVGGNYRAIEISDRELQRLVGLSHLETLDLGRQTISAAGLAALSSCSELKELLLNGSGIQTDAIPTVLKFQKLESFMFPLVNCDTWAEQISTLPMLRKVNAYRCDLTDTGVASLSKLPRLEELILSDCAVSDASLKALSKTVTLKSLYLYSELITLPGIAQLQQALPECGIRNDYPAEAPKP
jgi:serine/threonine protein kinase